MLCLQHFNNKSSVVNCYWFYIVHLKKKEKRSQLKKIVLEIMNFGSTNLTKPKKKLRNITKYYKIFTISFISNCGRSWSNILLFYFLCLQYFHNKI